MPFRISRFSRYIIPQWARYATHIDNYDSPNINDLQAMTGRNKLYGRRWRRLRQQYLADHPLCVFCTNEGRVSTATELDHIQKHEGNPELFYDVENLQGLCAHHHRSTKAQMERSGGIRGCTTDGIPLDPDHYWVA